MPIGFGIVMSKKFIFNAMLIALLAFFSWLMLLICIQYIPIHFDVAFLSIKQEEIKLPHYQIAFFTHVYTSLFTILAGFTQFSAWIRRKYKKLHRLIGKFYVFVILILAGPSGLVLALYAKGGFWSQLSFVILSILWLVFTFLAFQKVRKKDFIAHKKYIYMSYALTLSAISLRLWKWLIANTLALPPYETYIIVAWLAWTINLIVAYILIQQQKKLAL